jgi:hypothetical protein
VLTDERTAADDTPPWPDDECPGAVISTLEGLWISPILLLRQVVANPPHLLLHQNTQRTVPEVRAPGSHG